MVAGITPRDTKNKGDIELAISVLVHPYFAFIALSGHIENHGFHFSDLNELEMHGLALIAGTITSAVIGLATWTYKKLY